MRSQDCSSASVAFSPPEPDFDQFAEETWQKFKKQPRKQDEFYRLTYPIIRRACSRLLFDGSSADFERTEACILLVYSWMSPARFSEPISEPNYQLALDALRSLEYGGIREFEIVVQLLNGSIIGASKFLHFIAPQLYPMWDQHVARYCRLNYWYEYTRIDVYESYRSWLRSKRISKQALERTSKIIGISSAGQELRCKEFLLFQAGLALKSKTAT